MNNFQKQMTSKFTRLTVMLSFVSVTLHSFFMLFKVQLGALRIINIVLLMGSLVFQFRSCQTSSMAFLVSGDQP